MRHIISWSGGKDSTASVILMHEHQNELLKPGDEVHLLFAEVMFDKKAGVSAHHPGIISFVYEAKEVFESWGFKVHILRSDKDYLDVFYHKIDGSRDPARNGMTYGFVLPGGKCAVKRDCKLKPINEWKKANDAESVSYVGIAIDEPSRLKSMHGENHVSLLEMYGYTEEDAYNLCKKYGLLSPQYSLEGVRRDGCWVCPYSRECESREIKRLFPEAWEKFVSLEDTPNLGFPHWNPLTKETLHERDAYISRFKQLSIFDFV